MKTKHLAIAAATILMAALMFFAISEHLRNRALLHHQTQSTSALAASMGRLSDTIVALEKTPAIEGRLIEDMRITASQLSLVMLTSQIRIESLDAEAFSGLCKLVFNADKLFPVTSSSSVEAQMNELLSKQLKALAPDIRTESSSRSTRLGDRHECVLR